MNDRPTPIGQKTLISSTLVPPPIDRGGSKDSIVLAPAQGQHEPPTSPDVPSVTAMALALAPTVPLLPAPSKPVPARLPPVTGDAHQHPHPAHRGPTRVIALMNQKGGVGKTTTAANLGAALALDENRVLMIDLDPQAHLTLHFGLDPDQLDRSVYDLLTDDQIGVLDIIHHIDENLAILPAEVDLAGVEAELAPHMVTGRAQRMMKQKCEVILSPHQTTIVNSGPRPQDTFDYVLIDCPPSLGLLTINALLLAREVLVPMQAHFLALHGLSKLLETVSHIQQGFNPDLVVSGIVLCMHDGQTILANDVIADLSKFLEEHRDKKVPWCAARILQPPVRRNIKLAECPSFGQTIFNYAPDCAGAQDYRALARALVAQTV